LFDDLYSYFEDIAKDIYEIVPGIVDGNCKLSELVKNSLIKNI